MISASLVAFFASGPYLGLVVGLMLFLFLSVATSHTMNDDIVRAHSPWLRAYARQPRLFLLRAILVFLPVTFTLFMIGFWW